jgi:hypothetical protein
VDDDPEELSVRPQSILLDHRDQPATCSELESSRRQRSRSSPPNRPCQGDGSFQGYLGKARSSAMQ